MPDSNSENHAASEMEARVAARAAEIEAKTSAKNGEQKSDAPPDNHFVLDCLSRNKVGDATLFCSLFRSKYIFVQEWEKFLYWDKLGPTPKNYTIEKLVLRI